MDVEPPTPETAPLTPCTGVCRLDAGGHCLGCRRSLAEIAAWGSMDDEARRRVMEQLRQRRAVAS